MLGNRSIFQRRNNNAGAIKEVIDIIINKGTNVQRGRNYIMYKFFFNLVTEFVHDRSKRKEACILYFSTV